MRRGKADLAISSALVSIHGQMVDEHLSVALQAAREAGVILKEGFYNYAGYSSKGVHDLVTESDLRSERIILGHIRSSFPSHRVRSEEAGGELKASGYQWIVDPLDGTSNFASGNPYFSLSIALVHEGKALVGVVYNPITGELYHALRRQGAFLNDSPIRVSSKRSLSASFIAVAYAADEQDIRNGIAILQRTALSARRAVVNFAPALDLCNIARGRLDGLIDNGSTAEDHAAGSLILQEAGGKVQNLGLAQWDVLQTGVVASNGYIQEALIELAGT